MTFLDSIKRLLVQLRQGLPTRTPLKKLYKGLHANIKKKDSPFYCNTLTNETGTYEVFSYRLASYKDFNKPYALETRGSLFKVDDGIKCVSRPINKFFNYNENPLSFFHDKDYKPSDIEYAMIKLDGSVINSYNHNGLLYLKSHTSITSEYAQKAMQLIACDVKLYNESLAADLAGYTVTYELTTPKYRVVVPYEDEKLTVLNIRHRESGKVILGNELKELYPYLYDCSVFKLGHIHPLFPTGETISEIVDNIRTMKDIEGFVVVFKDGRMCKVKTDWYSFLHFQKDDINIPSRLYKAVINDNTDDLKQIFRDDINALKTITDMEDLVFKTFNQIVKDCEDFYNKYKHLDPTQYYDKMLLELPKSLNRHGFAFCLYNNKEPMYKMILSKKTHMKTILRSE